MRRYIAAVAVLIFTLGALPSGTAQGALPTGGTKMLKCDTTETSVPECVVSGKVSCSEYGSRFRELVQVVLVSGGTRYAASVSDTNGSFAMRLPCGRKYMLRIEFRDNGFDVGEVQLPDVCADTVLRLDIVHTGSYLELVRDVRNGIVEDDITYKLYAPEEPAP